MATNRTLNQTNNFHFIWHEVFFFFCAQATSVHEKRKCWIAL